MGDLDPIADLLIAMIPIFIMLMMFRILTSLLFPKSYRSKVKIVDEVDLGATTSKCSNCGINQVDSKEPWAVCRKCKKDPSWWMGVD